MTEKRESTYIAFQDSEKLRKNSEEFIRNIREKSRTSQIPILVEVMHGFLDEVIDTFILRSIELMKLSEVNLKLTNIAVITIKKTCHVLSNRILKKFKNSEVEDLAEYMDQLMVIMPNQDGEEVAFTALPISDAFADRMSTAINRVCTGNPRDNIDELVDVLIGLRDVVGECLYHKTLQRLKLGPINRKLVEVSYTAVFKATQAPLKKVVPGLSDEQLVAACTYYKTLIKEGPPHKEIYG